jgi:hypothetical protein
MKLNIEKNGKKVKIDFVKTGATKPVSVELDEAQVKALSGLQAEQIQALTGLLQTALHSEGFKFSIDL